MDIKNVGHKLTDFLKKNRYVMLILLIGLILMILPTGSKNTVSSNTSPPISSSAEESIEDALSKLLCKIQGAGEVEVLLTESAGAMTLYQTNDSIPGTESGNSQFSTVTITDSQRNQNGLIKQINPPIYRGAIVLCQGADSPAIRLAITEAVSKVTGLGADNISVLKMK